MVTSRHLRAIVYDPVFAPVTEGMTSGWLGTITVIYQLKISLKTDKNRRRADFLGIKTLVNNGHQRPRTTTPQGEELPMCCEDVMRMAIRVDRPSSSATVPMINPDSTVVAISVSGSLRYQARADRVGRPKWVGRSRRAKPRGSSWKSIPKYQQR